MKYKLSHKKTGITSTVDYLGLLTTLRHIPYWQRKSRIVIESCNGVIVRIVNGENWLTDQEIKIARPR